MHAAANVDIYSNGFFGFHGSLQHETTSRPKYIATVGLGNSIGLGDATTVTTNSSLLGCCPEAATMGGDQRIRPWPTRPTIGISTLAS